MDISRATRRTAVLVSALALASGLVWILNRDQPLLDSPLPQYALSAAIALLFATSSLVLGLRLIGALLPGRLRLEERLALGFAFGMSAFHFGVWLLGMAGLLNRTACLLLPALFLALGLPNALRLQRRIKSLAAASSRAARVPRILWLHCCGAFTAFVLVAHAFTTSSIGYDSAWYHLPVAEIYAARHAIRGFADGWYLGAFPQFASVTYAWAMVVAKEPALALTSCAFVELTFVASAVLGVVPCVRALAPGGGRASWAWATIALFPAVYLYPPRVEADYAAAAFAPALLLLTVRAYRRFEMREVVAWAIAFGAVAIVKYSAVSLLAFPGLLIFVRSCQRLIWPKQKRSETCSTILAALATLLLVTVPHWLKNLIFYKDPLFPQLSGADAFTPITHQFYLDFMKALWRPSPGWPGVIETLRAIFTFSFEPHEYASYNQNHPIFGSVFSLCLLPLLLLKRIRGGLVWYVAVLVGVSVWFRIHHQDRYLLALLPWMCAVTAVTLRELARQGTALRLLVGFVCLLQFAWGVRWAVRFVPLDAIREAVWAPTAANWREIQLRRWPTMVRVGRSLPPNATLMVHDERIRLGLQRNSVSDAQGWQTRLSFVELGSDAAIYDRLTQLGVTHLFGQTHSAGEDTLGGDLLYFDFFNRYGIETAEPEVRSMPLSSPPRKHTEARLVFVDACGAIQAPIGLYRVTQLNDAQTGTPTALKAPPVQLVVEGSPANEPLELMRRADFAVIGEACATRVPTAHAGLELLVTRGNLLLYWRPR